MKSRTLTFITVTVLFAALVIPVRLPAQGQKQQQPRYTVTDLGTFGGAFSNAFGISNKGSVVGWGELAGDADPVHAFLWRKGLMTDLGNFGGRVSQANTVNEADEVAGSSETAVTEPSGEDFCDTGDFLICLPFLWQHGVMTPLPTLGGNNGVATGINIRGQVVGYAETATPDPSCSASEALRVKPVLWEKGEAQELPTLPGSPIGAAFAINDTGQAVGVSADCDVVFVHALLWHNGTMIDLGDLGACLLSQSASITEVSGRWCSPARRDKSRLLLAERRDDRPWRASWGRFCAGGINDKGHVVGQSCDIDDNCSVFMWQNGVITDPNTLIPLTPRCLFDGGSINSRGEIVGVAVEKSTGDFRAF
jgi:probable HAF family extracellular repeat protein